ncbi:MAG: ribonuclease HI [Mucinivorans sp.]
MANSITIYTDGSALGNPGAGGYGTVMISGPFRREISQGFRLTTNNRMELLSVIVALEAIKVAPAEVTIYSDSKYVVDAVEKRWVFGWEKKDFKDKKNPDLWRRFLVIYRRHSVRFVWVKGHASNEENNRCDFLATTAARSGALLIDEQYEAMVSRGGRSRDTEIFC